MTKRAWHEIRTDLSALLSLAVIAGISALIGLVPHADARGVFEGWIGFIALKAYLRTSLGWYERLMAERQVHILATIPDIPPRIREDIIYKITNPVLFIWPSP